LRQKTDFAKALRKRSVWVEPLFGEAKQWHGLARFRLRRLWRVNIEALLIASVQNLKRLLKPQRSHPHHPDPARAIVMMASMLFKASMLLSLSVACVIPPNELPN